MMGLPGLGAGLNRGLPNIRMPFPGARMLQVGGGRGGGGMSLPSLGSSNPTMQLPKPKIPKGLK